MTRTLAALIPVFRPSRRRIAVRAIADASRKRGYDEGHADGYKTGWEDREALTVIARQPAAPARETVT